MLPEETEMLERDIQLERRKRAQARKERYAEEPVSPGRGTALCFRLISGTCCGRAVLIFRASRSGCKWLLAHVGKRLRDEHSSFHMFYV